MQERNIINGFTSAALIPLIQFYQRLIPFLLLALILIVVDARFGVLAAKKRGETVRRSRLLRRSANKLVDYICWVTLASLFGQLFGHVLGLPLLSILIMLLVFGIELSSIINNYFEYKGISRRFSLWRLLRRTPLADTITPEDTPETPGTSETPKK